MTETVDSEVRKIRVTGDDHIRLRPSDSDRVSALFLSDGRKKRPNFDKNSFEWLSENYKRRFGLRNFTWKTMFKGIRNEHLHEIKTQGDFSGIDAKYVHIIWDMIIEFGGIVNLDSVP